MSTPWKNRCLAGFAGAFLTVAGCSSAPRQPAAESVTPLARAHAHNDYLHPRPLNDALDHGFCSVEADIHLVDGRLLVAHDRSATTSERTLNRLYLAPLSERVKANGGRVFRDGPPFLLLIDIKADAAGAYAVLERELTPYRALLTRFTPTSTHTGAITVVLSGARPTAIVAAQAERWVGIDGRLSDLQHSPSPHLYPLISDNWASTFKVLRPGQMTPGVRERLSTVVREAHGFGCRIRFWGIPAEPWIWRDLADAGVDLINTDDLAGLQRFLAGSN